MRVVVLDSGIFKAHPIFKKRIPSVFTCQNEKWEETNLNEAKTLNPHGTAVCGIIVKQTDESVEIINFDIYDERPELLTQKTLSALRYIEKNVNCDIINMSLGVRTPNSELEFICQRLTKKGIIIVAAFDNSGAISYPAAYSFVIGVDASPRCTHADDFVYVENSPVNVRGKGGLQRVAWTDPLYVVNQGTSFAAPYVTAYIAELCKRGLSRIDVMENIREHAKYIYAESGKTMLPRCFEIKSAAIIPYNKEMQSIVTFRNYLPFKIHQVCDSRFSGHIGLPVCGLYDQEKAYTIQSADKLDWQNIDTVIIGHVSEMEGVSGKAIKREILQNCLDKNKNVYTLDSENVEEFRSFFLEKGLQIYCPNDVVINVSNSFGKLYLQKAPVLGIFGTTKRQGKFTLQLQLRYRLMKMGYKVGQLGTEPTSTLFGMEQVYPFGYNGIQCDDLMSVIEQINWMMHQIDLTRPEIILVGSQSGVIPQAYYNTGQIPLNQIAFLLGSKPDAVILCVNVDDSEVYIRRTICAVESIGSCKVICLALYPLAYTNGWKIATGKKEKASQEAITDKKKVLSENFKLPVAVMGDKFEEDIFISACLGFFGGKK